MKDKIRDALCSGEFCLFYQPKLNAQSGHIVKVEALSRWVSEGNETLPGVFLPYIEDDNILCEQFNRWVITEAIQQLQLWQEEDIYVKVCVNISPKYLNKKQFVPWLKEIIAESGVAAELILWLEFEILESSHIECFKSSNQIIQECKAMGITFALDDFGTGYSTLLHLKELSVDTVKIDKVFVADMLNDSENQDMIQAILAMANVLELNVTAEGAETDEQVRVLLQMGCSDIQGYAIARPMSKEHFREYMDNYTPSLLW